MSYQIIPLFVAIPFGAAFLVAIFGKWRKPLSSVIAVLATVALFILAIFAVYFSHKHPVIVYSVGAWKPPIGIALVMDGLSAFMLMVLNLVGCMISIFSVSYMERYTGKWKFFTLYLLILGGMNGVVVTGDFFNLYIFFEIALIAAFALIAFGVGKEELEASFKYAIMSTVGSLFVLLAIVLLYSYTSTLNMADVGSVLIQKGKPGIILMVSVLLLSGLGFKAALVPFHAWLPDAHPAAPAPISALLSGLLIKTLGFYVMFRVFFNVIGITPAISDMLMLLGVVSMLVGGFLALGQKDFKRLLAWSSVSQVGYIALGVGLGTPLGILGGLFHLFNHSVFKSLLFLNAGAVEYAAETRDLEKLGGLSQKMPVTTATNLLGSMSIAGVPPFSGFWSKLIIIVAAVQAGKSWYAVWAVVASILTLGAVLKILKFAFWGKLKDSLSGIREVPFLMQFSMIVLTCVSVLGGFLLVPPIRDVFLIPAVNVLLEGVLYAAKVWQNI
jgi:multicomponent Na+:H+ antiporter subunit D